MPLVRSKDKKPKSENIKKLMDEGYPQKQAIAISYSAAGEKKQKKKK